MSQTVLILGASGRFGRNAADAFWNAGWNVRLFDRTTDTLMQATKGVDVIVNGWNPPYPDWAEQVPSLTRDVIVPDVERIIGLRSGPRPRVPGRKPRRMAHRTRLA